MNTSQLKVTQIKSKNGRLAKHVACLKGLGIKKIHQTVLVNDTPETRGMIAKVYYMVKVEEI
ncbi:MAG: 50S ribosomal protein L30 [Methylococcaceae bacterium]|nr:50S ribosomal protein L30 [Methylococcaceae bacterium]